MFLVHHLIDHWARLTPRAPALLHKDLRWDYQALSSETARIASAMRAIGVCDGQRVLVYLPKGIECVCALFGSIAAGGIAVPVNPLLRPAQLGYTLRDAGASLLITSAERIAPLVDELSACTDLRNLLLVGAAPRDLNLKLPVIDWHSLPKDRAAAPTGATENDIAMLLYTSGSTGQPKGVALSHRNLLAGAQSVVDYLGNTADDRLLALLPLSFDYGLSQLTTAFSVGASAVLLDYLLPRDIPRAAERYAVTGIAALPPVWNQVAGLDWPPAVIQGLRYITNSGGSMPVRTTQRLRKRLPRTDIFLMYGLTEAFRSTYLAPTQIDQRPDSIGQAIPNVRLLVLRPDGSECAVDEPGELVHTGPLVAQGYWADPAATAARFRPLPAWCRAGGRSEIAVWSGDQVRRDAQGYLYFVGRSDAMIKVSGYRISPTEIEEIALSLTGVAEAVAVGVPHPDSGQAIVLLVESSLPELCSADLDAHCRRQLPSYMLPALIEVLDSSLPRNPNGKIDRPALAQRYAEVFSTAGSLSDLAVSSENSWERIK